MVRWSPTPPPPALLRCLVSDISVRVFGALGPSPSTPLCEAATEKKWWVPLGMKIDDDDIRKTPYRQTNDPNHVPQGLGTCPRALHVVALPLRATGFLICAEAAAAADPTTTAYR